LEPPRLNDEGFVEDFNAVRMYDTPGVLLKQILDDEVSYESMKNLFTDSAALSPTERDSIQDGLKRSIGSSRAGNALVDIISNPFVWLLFATSPGAGKSLEKSGRIFTSGKKQLGEEATSYAVNNASPLRALKLLGANHLTSGTALPAMVSAFTKRVLKLTEDELYTMKLGVGGDGGLDPLLDSIAKRFGVRSLKSLDPDEAPDVPGLKEFLKRANVFGYAVMSGLDKGRVARKTDIVRSQVVEFRRVDGSGGIDKISVSSSKAEQIKKALDERGMSKGAMAQENHEYQRKLFNLREEWRDAGGDIELEKKISDKADALKGAYRNDPRNQTESEIALRKIEQELFGAEGRQPIGTIVQLRPQEAIGEYTKKGITSRKRGGSIAYDEAVMGDAGKVTEGLYENVATSTDVMGLDRGGHMQEWLSANGFMPFINTQRGVMKARYVDLFGNSKKFKETGEIELDEGKIARVYKSFRRTNNMTDVERNLLLDREYQGPLGDIIGDEVIQQVVNGEMSRDGFVKLLVNNRKSDDLEYYMPRNVHSFSQLDASGAIVSKRVDSDSVRITGRDEASSRLKEKALLDSRIAIEDQEVISDYLKSVQDEMSPEDIAFTEIDKDITVLDKTIAKERNGIIDSLKRPLDARSSSAKNNRVTVRNLDMNTSVRKYLKSTRNDVALFSDEISDEVKAALADFPPIAQNPGSKLMNERNTFGGMSAYDVFDDVAQELGLAGDVHGESYLRGPLLQRMTGVMPLNDFLGNTALNYSQTLLKGMVDSPFMDSVAGMNNTSRNFVGSMRSFANKDLHSAQGAALGRDVTGGFYASTLGLNVGSAVLNLFQPMLFAQAWTGMDNMAKGYAEGIQQYFGYIADRIKLPMLKALNSEEMQQVEDLRRKHFRLSDVGGDDLLDIRKSQFEMLDSVAYTASGSRSVSGSRFWLSELPLKLFSHTEMFNRVVTGEATMAAMAKVGKAGDAKSAFKLNRVATDIPGVTTNVFEGDMRMAARASDNVKQMVQNTQYGSDIMNSPELFQSSALGLPWMRQFFTFPTRTLTGLTDSTRMVGGGERSWGVTGLQTSNPLLATAHDSLRLLGVSALIYEGGKNLLSADFSKGLAAESLYESTIVGPYLMGDDPNLPLPPLLDTVKGSVEALLESDKGLMGELLPRLSPGGIGMSKALRLAPQIAAPSSTFSGVQTQFADWTKIDNQGRVPVYKADGTLLEYRSAPAMVMGSLGLDRYMFQNEQEFTKYLIKNRQASVDFRRRYVDALLANNPERAMKVKRQYEAKFKMPLTVTREQMKSSLQRREVPVRERLLSNLPKNIRPQFAQGLVDVGGVKSQNVDEALLSTAEKMRLDPNRFNQSSEG